MTELWRDKAPLASSNALPVLEIDLEAGGEGAGEGDLHVSARGAKADEHVELPEVITRLGNDVAGVVLVIPEGFAFDKETTRMIVDGSQVQLVQDGFGLRLEIRGERH